MSDRKLISFGSQFEKKIGYSRAVAVGRWVFVSGTTGFDYATMTISDDVVAQTDQCFKNIAAALAQAGSSLAVVVRVHYLLKRKEDFEPIWPVLQQYFGDVRPACTVMVTGLVDEKMLIEIEVTALKAGD